MTIIPTMTSSNYQYPEFVNHDDQFTPELMVLWDEALKDLEARRNRTVLWQAPIFILFWLISSLILGEKVVYLAVIGFVIFGLLAQSMRPNYDYTVSKDRSSAKFELNHIFRIKYLFEFASGIFTKNVPEDMGSLLSTIVAFITFPIWWSLYSLLRSFDLFNNLWWLKGFKAWTERLQNVNEVVDSRQHIRGTNILPSVELSGTSPNSLPPEPLEIADGNVTLLPNGGILIEGGATFDRTSTFGNFNFNGVTLTRESIELLTVSHKGSESSFRFDGNSWIEA